MPSSMQVEVALDELNQAHGHLTPDLVVQAAQDEQSPIHSIFEWDNAKAGHQHRLWQARRLIRSVQIERPDGKPMPKYLSVKIEGDRQYEEASIVVLDRDKWAVVLEETASALTELEQRIETLVQLSDSVGRKDLAYALQADVAAARERFLGDVEAPELHSIRTD